MRDQTTQVSKESIQAGGIASGKLRGNMSVADEEEKKTDVAGATPPAAASELIRVGFILFTP